MYGVEILKYVVTNLNEHGFEYMISGSQVLGLYVVARSSRDIDFVINLKENDLEKFFSIFPDDKFHVNRQAIKVEVLRKGFFSISSEETNYKLDFILKKNSEYRDEEFSRKQFMKLLGIDAWVVSKEDLLLSKLIWIQELQSEIQMRDIADLLECEDLDFKYVEEWIRKLNLKTFGLI